MAIYHVSEDGPRRCKATVGICPYAKAGEPHFESAKEAQVHYENVLGEDYDILYALHKAKGSKLNQLRQGLYTIDDEKIIQEKAQKAAEVARRVAKKTGRALTYGNKKTQELSGQALKDLSAKAKIKYSDLRNKWDAKRAEIAEKRANVTQPENASSDDTATIAFTAPASTGTGYGQGFENHDPNNAYETDEAFENIVQEQQFETDQFNTVGQGKGYTDKNNNKSTNSHPYGQDAPSKTESLSPAESRELLERLRRQDEAAIRAEHAAIAKKHGHDVAKERMRRAANVAKRSAIFAGKVGIVSFVPVVGPGIAAIMVTSKSVKKIKDMRKKRRIQKMVRVKSAMPRPSKKAWEESYTYA